MSSSVVKIAEHPGERSLAKGLVAGLIGGIIATAAKSLAEKIYPPKGESEPSETIHWTFGAAAGAAYGAIAEFYPAATAKDGANFGLTLAALTHEHELEAETGREKTSEMASHVVFGLVTETVRRFVRKRL